MLDVTTWLKTQASGEHRSAGSSAHECLALEVGRVVKEPGLTYLEAMNALQMMDINMDTGLRRDNMNIFDPASCLTSEQVCWIMDEMLALEMAWYKGATLSQTVYTCLYYLNPQYMLSTGQGQELVSSILRSYVLAWGKTIDFAYQELSKGHVFDGEDCWLDHYGLPIRMMDAMEDIILTVEDAIDWLEYSDGELTMLLS